MPIAAKRKDSGWGAVCSVATGGVVDSCGIALSDGAGEVVWGWPDGDGVAVLVGVGVATADALILTDV